jgi:hypothetical protein
MSSFVPPSRRPVAFFPKRIVPADALTAAAAQRERLIEMFVATKTLSVPLPPPRKETVARRLEPVVEEGDSDFVAPYNIRERRKVRRNRVIDYSKNIEEDSLTEEEEPEQD